MGRMALTCATQVLGCNEKMSQFEGNQRVVAPSGTPLLRLLHVVTVLLCSWCKKRPGAAPITPRHAPSMAVALAVALFPSLNQAQDKLPVLPGTVTKIVDGDTIDVQLSSGPIRVRLHGVDTPERGQPWGKESTAALTALVMGKEVDIEPSPRTDTSE